MTFAKLLLDIIYSTFLLAILLFISCEKESDPLPKKCPSSISGRVLDKVTGIPLADVKVYGQGIGGSSDWGNPLLLPFDTLTTDSTGFFEFHSEWNIPNWNIQTWTFGYDFTTQSYWGTDCQELNEDIYLDQFATIIVTTIDNPTIHFDSLVISTLPGIGYDFYEGYGKSNLMLLPNEVGKMWHKPDSEGLIRYWFRNDPKDEIYDVKIDAQAGDTLLFMVEM